MSFAPSPLSHVLLRTVGLSEQQIAEDNWAALFSLPPDAVNAIMTVGPLSPAAEASLDRNATLDVLKVTPSSERSLKFWCVVVGQFACSDRGQRILATPEVRDAVLARRPRGRLASTETCGSWCAMIVLVTRSSAAGKRTFGTAEVREALVAVRSHAATADACKWWCAAVCSLAYANAANQRLLGTVEVRDALVELRPQAASSAGACEQWCAAICYLVFATADVDSVGASPETLHNLQLLRVDQVRQAHAALQGVATSGNASILWANAARALHGDQPWTAQDRASAAALTAETPPAPARTAAPAPLATAAEAAPAAAAPLPPPSTAPAWLAALMIRHAVQLEPAAINALIKNDINCADTFVDLKDDEVAEIQQGLSIGARKTLKRLVDAVKQQPPAVAAAAASTPAVAAAASLADMADEDFATTQRFAARLPVRYHLPIDDLELGEHLQSGGMGAVIAARLRSTREHCVVKLNKDATPAAVRRYLREIYTSLTVQHRFIARPLGVAFATGGVSGVEALLVLERGVCSLEDFVLAKRQLQQSAAAAQMPDTEVEQYFGFARQIAFAMAFLHARGALHLDQKPANVVLFSTASVTTAANAQLANVDLATLNVAKIVDLGLAVLSRTELEEGFGGDALTHMTATSTGATMAYASHEQLHAHRGTLLRPTMDVYSFGAILYRLLCVSKPHEGRNQLQILQHKLIDDAMNEDNLLPAFRAANNTVEGSARSATVKQMVAVMRRCLQHEPAERPKTGTDVLRLLLREGEELPEELAAATPASSAATSGVPSSLADAIQLARSGISSAGAGAGSGIASGLESEHIGGGSLFDRAQWRIGAASATVFRAHYSGADVACKEIEKPQNDETEPQARAAALLPAVALQFVYNHARGAVIIGSQERQLRAGILLAALQAAKRKWVEIKMGELSHVSAPRQL